MIEEFITEIGNMISGFFSCLTGSPPAQTGVQRVSDKAVYITTPPPSQVSLQSPSTQSRQAPINTVTFNEDSSTMKRRAPYVVNEPTTVNGIKLNN